MPMDTIKHKPDWIKDKQVAPDFEIFKVPEWDDYKDFVMDEGCYVLIKIYRDRHEAGVAVCNYKHVILKEFRGRRAQDLYNAVLRYDSDNKLGWFKRLEHAAYLGKELKKAEIALAMGCDYYQE